MEEICKATHIGFGSECVLEAGHDGVHADGVLHWREAVAVYPSGIKVGLPIGDPATEVGGTVSRPAKKTAAKRAPKKEG